MTKKQCLERGIALDRVIIPPPTLDQAGDAAGGVPGGVQEYPALAAATDAARIKTLTPTVEEVRREGGRRGGRISSEARIGAFIYRYRIAF